jgi:hypothetical protein
MIFQKIKLGSEVGPLNQARIEPISRLNLTVLPLLLNNNLYKDGCNIKLFLYFLKKIAFQLYLIEKGMFMRFIHPHNYLPILCNYEMCVFY